MKQTLVLLVILLTSGASYGCQLKVRLNHYPPISYKSPQQQWQGLDVEILHAMLKRAKCQYTTADQPWARSIPMLADGKIDVMASMSKLPERQKFARFIGPYRNEHIALVSNSSDPITLKQLQQFVSLPKPIAMLRGAYYGEAFTELLNRNPKSATDFLFIDTHDVKLSLLQKGRVSGLLKGLYNVSYQLKYYPQFKNLKIHYDTVHLNPVYIAVSLRSVEPAIFERLNTAFNNMQQDGSLDRIAKKYHQEYIKAQFMVE